MLEAIILAGGLGSRLQEAVPYLPKPLAPIRGRPFLEYVMDYWITQGVTRFIISVGYRRQQIIANFGLSYRGCELAYAEESVPLGSGGGLLLAIQKLKYKKPFLVLNGDTYFQVDYIKFYEFHLQKNALITLALHKLDGKASRYMGIDLDNEGMVNSIGVKLALSNLINGGVYLMSPSLFDSIPWCPGDSMSLEDEFFPFALNAGKKICGTVCNGKFIDIGIPADYKKSHIII